VTSKGLGSIVISKENIFNPKPLNTCKISPVVFIKVTKGAFFNTFKNTTRENYPAQ
jgi:hypothetical protein